MRLRWEVTDETIGAVLESRAIQRLPEEVRDGLRKMLGNHAGSRFVTQQDLSSALGTATAQLGLTGPTQRAVWTALAVRDEEAPLMTDRSGNPGPDPELRDNENVPLPPVPVSYVEDPTERFATSAYRSAVDGYMREEVLPYVPDAWVDHDRTKTGYEIPLTRHFYQYVPPRLLEEIDADIQALEDDIQALLNEVAA